MRINLLILSLLVFVSGCAAFREEVNPPITKWPPEISQKNKSITVQVSGNAIMNDEQKDVNVRFLEKWRAEVIRAYESSGLFSAVKSGSEQSDIYADVKITDKGQGSMGLAVLTGLTLYLVPSKAQDCFIVRTTYKNNEGTTLGVVEKSECINFWQQLFLFPVMFTNFPGSVAKDVLFDLNRHTILEANTKGTF